MAWLGSCPACPEEAHSLAGVTCQHSPGNTLLPPCASEAGLPGWAGCVPSGALGEPFPFLPSSEAPGYLGGDTPLHSVPRCLLASLFLIRSRLHLDDPGLSAHSQPSAIAAVSLCCVRGHGHRAGDHALGIPWGCFLAATAPGWKSVLSNTLPERGGPWEVPCCVEEGETIFLLSRLGPSWQWAGPLWGSHLVYASPELPSPPPVPWVTTMFPAGGLWAEWPR